MVKLPASIPNEPNPANTSVTKDTPAQSSTRATPPVKAKKGKGAAKSTQPTGHPDRLDWQIALLLGATAFALYLRILAPDILPGDSGEFHFAAWRLGLAHPTGYPLYLTLGWLWQHTFALFGASPAWSLNAMSAFTAAIGVMLLYWAMLRWTPPPIGRRRLAGVYSGALLISNLTYWSQALIAEVYALHVVLMLLLLLATQRLVDSATKPRLLMVAFLAGLSLTHHALTLLWLPALLLYWLLSNKGWRQFSLSTWGLAILVGIIPMLLYAYIPLRAGPEASPWYHQRLGDGTLSLIQNDLASYWAFINGQSISVGFRSLSDAWAQIPQAAWLWHYHFGWVGLAMMAVGLFWLARTGRHAILIATLVYVIMQQSFNLFYNIGDILVYYIPLYLVGSMWAGFGLAGVAVGEWRFGPDTPQPQKLSPIGGLIGGVLLLLALRDVPATSAQIDQSTSTRARQQWEAIFAAQPAADAILVSNDRNDIVPLFYFQAVEDRGLGMTGLFPIIAPDARFADIATTLDTALQEGGDQPVYLIKEMPGLDVRFDLQPVTPPLVQVNGPVATQPSIPVGQAYGPLQLLGYDLTMKDGSAEVALYWQVNEAMNEAYVATAQLLGADDNTGDSKIAQDDHAPGGDYYPTSLWKVGETLVVRHTLSLDDAHSDVPLSSDVNLLVGFYRASDTSMIAQPLLIPVDWSP